MGNKTEHFNITIKGERHNIEGTPCQDYSLSLERDGVTVAVVCDGHGGKPYFRSDKGAKLAAGIASYCLFEFAKNIEKSLLCGHSLQSFRSLRNEASTEEQKSELRETFLSLYATILYLWDLKIKEDISNNPFTTEELQSVPTDYADLLKKGAAADVPYGTTLIAYMQTADYWLSLQIGDGIAICHDGEEWSVPIPNDESCHDNITTSLCDNNALDEFRVCYEANGHFPEAMFLFTDGMEKAFLSTEKLADYNKRMLNVLRYGGKKDLVKTLADMLPKFSRLTSGDDISVACVYNKTYL